MGGEKYCPVGITGKVVKEAHDLDTAGNVEEGRWFVEHHDLRFLGKGACNHDFLPLPVAELCHVALCQGVCAY